MERLESSAKVGRGSGGFSIADEEAHPMAIGQTRVREVLTAQDFVASELEVNDVEVAPKGPGVCRLVQKRIFGHGISRRACARRQHYKT